MRNLGIHTRLFLVALFLITASVVLMVFLGLHTTRQFMIKRFQDRMAFLAKYLALNSELGVLIGDTEGLRKLSRNLLREEDVMKVVILDNKGNKLVEEGEEDPRCNCVVERPVLLRRSSSGLLFGSMQDSIYRHPRGIGVVRLLYSTNGIDQLMKTITYQYALSSFVIIVLCAVLFYFISRSLVKEVTALASTARKVGEGELGLRAKPGSLPETRELAVAFNTMLDSLAEKREALVKANQEVIRQKALAEVGKFSLMVAHEVKNPLSIIRSSLDILKADRQIPSEDPMIIYIEDEIKRLNKLIEDFLIFARPSEVKLRMIDLNRLSKDVVARAEYLDTNKGLRVYDEIPEEECEANADPELLTGALWNIVKNSCEATNGKGRVWVRAYQNGTFWMMEVEDDGVGVSEENKDRIFEPFFTTKAKGTGLGLTFASQVIAAHGGQIQVERSKEGGALFRIKIPRRVESASNGGRG